MKEIRLLFFLIADPVFSIQMAFPSITSLVLCCLSIPGSSHPAEGGKFQFLKISVPQLAAVGIPFPVCRRVEGFRIHTGAFLRRHAGTARHKTPGNKQQKQKKTNHGVKPSFPVFSPGKPSPDFFFLKQQSVVKHSER